MGFLAAAFVLSGASGLVYQVVWTRLLILVFGSTTIAVSTVLTVFMGGLALGAVLGGRWIDRWPRPLAMYVGLELAVGAYGLSVPWALDRALPVYQLVWNETASSPGLLLAVRVLFIAVILIIPTTLMGATLPVLSRAIAPKATSVPGLIGRFYAINTTGAVIGAFGAGFLLMPAVGVTPTIWAAVAGNLAAAGAAWVVLRRWRRTDQPIPLGVPPARISQGGRPFWVAATLAVSGAAALVDEVAWSRALGLIIGSSVYAFTAMLTTFLIGLAAGAAAGVWLMGRMRARLAMLGAVQIAIAAAGLTTVALLAQLPFALVWAAGALRAIGPWSVPLAQFALSFLVMWLPTFGFGLVFPIALHLLVAGPDTAGGAVGRLYAINTAGAIGGAFLAGFVLLPAVGVQGTLFLAVGVSLLLGIALTVADASVSRARSFGIGLGLVAAAVVVGAAVPTWSATLMSSGVYWNLPRYVAGYDEAGIAGVEARMPNGRTLYHREGLTATVVVEQDPDGNRSLTINGRTESGDLFMRTQVLIAHWPVWLAPRADRVLVIGFGSGATAGSVLRHPVRHLDVVELEAAVIEASRLFEPENGRPLADPRTRVSAADGRNFLLLTPDRYDVIMSQPSLPWVAGAATLFTQEFFDIAAAHLAPGGVFGQWVDAGAMGHEQLQSVLAAFALVFPHLLVVEPTPGDLLLIGSPAPLALDPRGVAASFADPVIAADLRRVDIGGPRDLYQTLLGDEVTVKPLLIGAIPNRDENVYVEFSGLMAFAGILSGRRDGKLEGIPRGQAARAWNALLARGIE